MRSIHTLKAEEKLGVRCLAQGHFDSGETTGELGHVLVWMF